MKITPNNICRMFCYWRSNIVCHSFPFALHQLKKIKQPLKFHYFITKKKYLCNNFLTISNFKLLFKLLNFLYLVLMGFLLISQQSSRQSGLCRFSLQTTNVTKRKSTRFSGWIMKAREMLPPSLSCSDELMGILQSF